MVTTDRCPDLDTSPYNRGWCLIVLFGLILYIYIYHSECHMFYLFRCVLSFSATLAKRWKVQFRLGLSKNSTMLIQIMAYKYKKITILCIYMYVKLIKKTSPCSVSVIICIYIYNRTHSLYYNFLWFSCSTTF